MTIDPQFDPLKERLQRAVAPDYRVEHRIGEGGMGVVYRAHQVRLNRAVAIKVLRPALFTADGAEAFLREALTLADETASWRPRSRSGVTRAMGGWRSS
jgi:serine/threonine protein kinase